MQRNRNRYSFLNAISAMGLTLVNGLLGIVVTHFVIARFGSDFNGLNSTANQIVNVLLIIDCLLYTSGKLECPETIC